MHVSSVMLLLLFLDELASALCVSSCKPIEWAVFVRQQGLRDEQRVKCTLPTPSQRYAVVQQNLFSSSISLARMPRQMGCIRPRVAYATATWRYELLWLLLRIFFFSLH